MTKVSHALLFVVLSFISLVGASKALAVNKDGAADALGEEAPGYGPLTLVEGRDVHLEQDDDERPKRFDSFMNGFGTAKRSFDEINRSNFGFNKRNFDEINRSSFGFNKRNFDEINRSNFGFNKRNFDEINRSAFGFSKRNFDEINRSAFGFNKRNFDEINRSSFGFHSPSAIRRSQKPSAPSGFSYYFPFFKRSEQPGEKKSFDEINRSHFGFAG